MIEKLHISIAMCTYNGEKYLQEQLDSFLQQTRLPDELVVCDDGSQDSTVAILQAYADQAPFPVRIYINSEQLGASKNFEQAISRCNGDIITLSDQDDTWVPTKLMKFDKVFLKQPNVGLVFSNAEIIDENKCTSGYSLWDFYNLSFSKIFYSPHSFIPILFKRISIHGCTIGFRGKLCDLILPMPPYWCHDEWIPFVSNLVMGVFPMPDELMKYRQHSSQVSGVKCFGFNLTDKINLITNCSEPHFRVHEKKWIEALSLLSSDKRFAANLSLLAAIEDKIVHLKIRSRMPKQKLKRLPIIFREIIARRYSKYSSGWKSIARDLLLQ
jgi:glycosyltransferase involved in cell wall biosynthesis